jgi:NADH:ubiquinone oxidoreductase subunit 6 (subunit J)
MFFEYSFFLLLALLTFLISWTRNVFMSLMYSVMLFVNASLVLFVLGFEFLALVNLLVYVGALAVLFLFVIMLLNIPTSELRAFYRGKSFIALGAVSFVVARMLFVPTFNSINVGFFKPTQESINAIGEAFYIRFADVLIFNSLVLTTALFGALVLVTQVNINHRA